MGSGFLATTGSAIGTKTAAAVAAGTLAVTAAAGAGMWWVSRGPELTVVQRSVSLSVAAGGEQVAVASCQAHETALGGGYAIAGGGFATNSLFMGRGAWMASAYNPGDKPATLTSYALCINAAPEFLTLANWPDRAHAFQDRGDKNGTDANGVLIHDLTTDGPLAGLENSSTAVPSCPGGFTEVGAEFHADRILSGRAVAPVPLDQLSPAAALPALHNSGPWVARLNPGTRLTSRLFPVVGEGIGHQTRIEDPQPPQANYALALRPICVRLKNVSVATAQVAVAAGAQAHASVSCPKGKLLVGGGFAFPTANEEGNAAAPHRFFGDGWLYASSDAPAAGEPSGRKVTAWHVTGANQQKAGTDYYNSVWIEHSDRETLTGQGYFDTHGRGPDDQELSAAAVPAEQPLIAGAVCAKIDAKATEPAKAPPPPALTHPDLPHALDPLPLPSGSAASPPATSPGASPTPSPTGSPGTSSTPGTPNSPGRPRTSATPTRPGPPSQSGSPTRQQPQPPAVSIQQPTGGGQLRRGCEESFAGTARTRPGDQALTDPQYTSWRINGPNGPVTLGTGASGRFVVPLLPDGTYTLVFTATDPAAGLTGSAQTSVRIVGCLR
ncbi:hypothetical protein ABZ128_26055 [Streptomyces sp. NPDC006326]|uniref:hypothetical protein n=1 Tax=Streptomyces sp. NPDC006326 TaxID=3156752 RepID=UPI0033A1C331